jgi:hypothetical protein
MERMELNFWRPKDDGCNGTPKARVRCVTAILGPRLAGREIIITTYSQSTFGPVDPASAVPLFFQLQPVRRTDWMMIS